MVPAVYVGLVLFVCIGQIYVKFWYPVFSLLIVATGIPAYMILKSSEKRAG